SSRGKRMKIDRLNLNYEFGKLRSIFAALAVLALVLCTAFSARGQVTTAAVRGTVTDEQGAALAGADVSITNTDNGFTRSTKTGNEGEYSFPDLPLGPHRIHAAHPGFKAETQPGVVLHVAGRLVIHVSLAVAAVREPVPVEASRIAFGPATGEL